MTQTEFSPTSSSTLWVDFILRNPETGRVTNTALSVKRQGREKKKCVCVNVYESMCVGGEMCISEYSVDVCGCV